MNKGKDIHVPSNVFWKYLHQIDGFMLKVGKEESPALIKTSDSYQDVYIDNHHTVYWIIGVMCSGKTTISDKIGNLLDLKPFHLDHINQSIPLVQAYQEAIQTG